jgi:hypothetical protein
MILLSISGAHATTPPEAGSRASGTSSAADPASFNPAGWDAEDTLWICTAGCGETSTSGAFQGLAGAGGGAPANYGDNLPTGISADVVGGVEGGAYFRQLNAAAENVGPISPDTSNARNAAFVIAIRPVVVVPFSADLSASGFAMSPQSTARLNEYAAAVTAAGLAFVGQAVNAAALFAAQITAAAMGLTAQANTWLAKFNAQASAGSFGMTPQATTRLGAFAVTVSAASLAFVGRAVGAGVLFVAELTAPAFSLAAQANTWLANVVAQASAGSFGFVPQQVARLSAFVASTTSAAFGLVARAASYTAGAAAATYSQCVAAVIRRRRGGRR